MKKIDGDLKAVRDFDKGCISLLHYVVLRDEHKTGEGIIFLRQLQWRGQITGAACNRETISLSSLLCAACGNRTVVCFAATGSTLAPVHRSTGWKACSHHCIAECAQSEYSNE
jgi:hypothetical protein